MKRIAVGVLGGLLLLVGIALLVLPGPGWLLIAAALAVLATEFEWAGKGLGYAKGQAEKGVAQVGRNKLQAALAVGFAVAMVAVGLLDIAGVHIPFVSTVSAVLLIIGGLFLVGTVWYALRQARRAGSAVDGSAPVGTGQTRASDVQG